MVCTVTNELLSSWFLKESCERRKTTSAMETMSLTATHCCHIVFTAAHGIRLVVIIESQ